MYIYYDKEGNIKAVSPTAMEVKDCKELHTTKDIDPTMYKVVNNKLSKQRKQVQTVFISEEPVKPSDGEVFLNETDWKMTRHRDQVELGVETSLTDEEFKILLAQRQKAREGNL